jgi:hypothetical protein
MLNVKSQEAPVVEEGLKTALIQVQVVGGAAARRPVKNIPRINQARSK